jgi:peroxiredoxin
MRYRAVVLLSAVFGFTVCFCQSDENIQVGQRAPDFSLPYATKDSIAHAPLALSAVVGKRNIVLAFYPADWSTGCTKEVCTLRDDFGSLEKLNAEILAISGDYVWSHFAWAKFQKLPFRLLSDHLHTVAKLYDSYNELSGYNKRTVFVVNKQGTIAYEDLEYSVGDQNDFDRLKEELAKLQ